MTSEARLPPEAMARLHALCFPERPWRAGEFSQLLAARGTLALVSPDADGFLLARIAGPEAEILTLAVHPEARRRGIARALVGRLVARAPGLGIETLFLDVAADNGAARGLYRGLGFTEVGRRPGYYARPDGRRADALVLRREVTPGRPE